MKARYEKMIDEYVKKHYGDLDRGVLSNEVKYKVLFKIYRKKYRKEKNMREHLEKTVKDWCCQNKALELPEDLDRKLFPWRLASSPDKVLPKDDGFNQIAGAAKNCTLCKHSRMLSALNYEGAYTSCLWCNKKNEKRSALNEVCEDFE